MRGHLAIFLCVVIFIHQSVARLVFPPNSDVGYIVADDAALDIQGAEGKEGAVSQFFDEGINANVIVANKKSTVKRAFWNSLSDDMKEKYSDNRESEKVIEEGGIDPWQWNAKNSQGIGQNAASQFVPKGLEDTKHGVKMGVKDDRCDNGKIKLSTDWDGSPVNHTCYTPKNRFRIGHSTIAVTRCDPIAEDYSPKHFCMNQTISYNETIPAFGDHRPLWPVFGEYKFVPRQRWLHNIEHGAVVMLYHPCAHPLVVNQLKEIVRGCIYKHVITPDTLVSEERPLVLVTWGCRLEMSHVDEDVVRNFIRQRALHGPEGKYSKQGSFVAGLLHASTPPPGSDIEDSNLCL